MVKKLLWMSIAVLVTAYTFYIANGQVLIIPITPTQCSDCAATITATYQSTIVQTQQYTPTTAPVSTSTTVPPTPTLTKTTIPPTATQTLAPTNTTTPVPTYTATAVPSATSTATSTPSFLVQTGSPVYLTNFAHQDLACNWEGVAGQVFDISGNPLSNYVIKVNGTYNGDSKNLLGITGMAAGAAYGPKGYEILIGTTVAKSTGTLTIQLFDANGISVTDPIKMTTYASCTQNLIIYNFIKQ
jgi:hypothetical protein